MKIRLFFTIFAILSVVFLLSLGCGGQKKDKGAEEPVVLKEGKTEPAKDYYINDKGEIIYLDNPTGSENGESGQTNFPPIFPGSQQVFPANEDPKIRSNYITRAPFDAIKEFYTVYLEKGVAPGEEMPADAVKSIVNTVSTKAKDGSKKALTLFVNTGEGPRGGMKVILKEYPAQHTTQIVLTTLSAPVPGLDPYGYWASPEEVAQWAKEWEAKKAEEERKRKELEKSSTEPKEIGGSSENKGGG